MGEDERQASTPVGGAEAAGSEPAASEKRDRTPEEIRRDIEQTRQELGDTVAAVAEKADVKGQAKAKVDEVKGRVTGKKEEFAQRAKDGAPEGAGDAAQKAQVVAQENSTALAIGGAAFAGFILGRLTKRS